MAAGLKTEFLLALRAILGEQRLRLSSIKPRLVFELRQAPRALARAEGWVLCCDSDRLVLLGLRQGQPVVLHNHRAAGDDLAAELRAFMAASGPAISGENLFVCGEPGGIVPAGRKPMCWSSALPEGALG